MESIPSDWSLIEGLLDEGMDTLDETDRSAIVLRYFENKSLREVGATLGTSGDAAQKRVSRAVERLREFFTKRGVTVAASGLVVVISANAVQAAPAGLAAAISSAAVIAGTTTVAATTTATITKAIAMTALQKTLITATIAVTVSAGFYEAKQASTLREQAQTFREQIQTLQQQTPLAASSNKAALAALQDKIDRLATQNAELTNALAQANADKAQLETEREQARHSAALFKELADQASPGDKNSTNDYPTVRHVMAGWGRLGRLSAQLSKDESNLSDEEKTANEAARLNALGEIGNLMKAMKQLEMNKPPGSSSSMGDDPADSAACLLYGALNLNEQQFNDVYGVLDRYRQQAKQDNLLETNAAPETAAALKKLTDQAMAEVRSALTPEQARIFEDISPYIHVGPGKFNFSFNFAEKK